MNAGKKRGTILLENIIFIILNLLFISILILFIYLKSENAAVLEEVYAKQIALIIDSAKPGMIINLDMEKAIETAKKELGEDRIKEIVSIDNNIVTVKLREKGGYEYSFFNNVDVNAYPDTNGKDYVIVINELKAESEVEEKQKND
jgi:hypothetical protein